MMWAKRLGNACKDGSARLLHNRYLCSNYFLKRDFTIAERIHLNKVAVPCGSDSA
jgi:hypothetical protein